jgi:hypothetical protein
MNGFNSIRRDSGTEITMADFGTRRKMSERHRVQVFKMLKTSEIPVEKFSEHKGKFV